MPYCIYLRKSRADIEAETRGEGETLARHKRALMDLADRMQLNVAQIYHEVVSGETIAARPEMQKLLADVDAGRWEGVIVMDVDRLARGDTIDQGIMAQAFKFSSTKIITPAKTYDPSNEFDEQYFEFNLFMSRQEYKTIRRRMERGRVASVKEGKYTGNRPPYGYRRVKLPGKGFTLEPDPDQAPVVKMIFEWYVHGIPDEQGAPTRIGVSKIVRRLNDMGVKPVRAEHWVNATVQCILENPVYCGKVRINYRPQVKRMESGRVAKSRPRVDPSQWVLANGLHEPLIDESTYAAAIAFRRQNPPRPVIEAKIIQNPLAGLVVCGVCGHKMIRRPYAKKNQPDSLLCYLTSCPNVSTYLNLVEQKVLIELARWCHVYKLTFEAEGHFSTVSAEAKKKQLKKLEKDLLDLDQQRGNLHDLLERGVYSVDVYFERSRKLAARVSDAQHARDTLVKEIESDATREQAQRLVIPMVENLLKIYHNLPSAKAKNDLLKDVIEKVVYIKTKKSHRTSDEPDSFEIELYPRLPLSRSSH